MSKIYNQLQQVQLNLVAPKSQYNSFGKYSYRSAEDILESVKSLLATNNLILTLSDDLVFGNDVYVKSTAKVTNFDGESIEVTAYAREASELKGMQPSQITGSTSSYARKYALNGLFCIDDTKDADTLNTHGKEVAKDTPTKEYKENVANTDDNLKCSSCGVEIIQAVKAYSEKHYGKALCRDCQAKEKK